jgi:hypothetical protein
LSQPLVLVCDDFQKLCDKAFLLLLLMLSLLVLLLFLLLIFRLLLLLGWKSLGF